MEFLYCVLFLICSGILIFFIGRIYPRKWINEKAFPFKSYKFENNGKFYNKFKIKKWKTKLPDASVIISKIIPGFMPKKRLDKNPKEKIKVLIKESCVAEMTHAVSAIVGWFCVKIWSKYGFYMSVLWTCFNLPFI